MSSAVEVIFIDWEEFNQYMQELDWAEVDPDAGVPFLDYINTCEEAGHFTGSCTFFFLDKYEEIKKELLRELVEKESLIQYLKRCWREAKEEAHRIKDESKETTLIYGDSGLQWIKDFEFVFQSLIPFEWHPLREFQESEIDFSLFNFPEYISTISPSTVQILLQHFPPLLGDSFPGLEVKGGSYQRGLDAKIWFDKELALWEAILENAARSDRALCIFQS